MSKATRDRGDALILQKPIIARYGAKIENHEQRLFSHCSETIAFTTNQWNETSTGATGAQALALVASGLGGEANTIVGSDATAGRTLSSQLSFECDTTAAFSPMVFEIKMKVSSVAATEFFIGFKDAKQDANDKSYVVSATSTLTTSVPADAVGFIYSATPTSGTLFNAGGNLVGSIGSNNGTDTPVGGATILDTNYHVYRIELRSDGAATLFLDGNFYLGVAAGVGPRVTIPLCTAFNVAGLAANKTYTFDYLYAADGGRQNTSTVPGY